jgi:hypothetical protein
MIMQEAQDQEPVQMAAASFKTFTAISRLYLLRQRDVAKGVLFIVGKKARRLSSNPTNILEDYSQLHGRPAALGVRSLDDC